MKHQLKLLTALTTLAAATTLQAQPYYVTGGFNGWDTGANPMTDDGDGSYSLITSGQTAGASHEWLIITSPSYNPKWPNSNARAKYDGSGGFTFHFFPGLQNDGWDPLQDRVGYDDPGQHGWEVIGSFDGFSAPVVTLTNMGNGLYEGAYVVPAAGSYEYKFRKVGDWDVNIGLGFGTGNNIPLTTTSANQVVTFRLDLPKGRYLAGDPSPAATNKVTFLVNMEVPIALFNANNADPGGFDPASDSLYVRGDFNSWTASAPYELQPVVPGGTLYSNTVDIVAYGGTTINYKFFGDAFPGEEDTLLSCGGTRTLQINSTVVSAPLANWGDRTLSDPTNAITLQVDMATLIATGGFDPLTDNVYVRGSFNNWGNSPGSPLLLTNLAAPSTNIYAGVLHLTNWPVGACLKYKFWNGRTGAPNSGYESINDRQLYTTSPTQVVAAAFFNNIEICDVIEQTNQVTFSVNMAGAVGTDATVYDGSQSVYLNGDFAGWWGWGNTNDTATNYLMSKSGDIYSLTVPLPPGNNLRLAYKYSMNGADNEAGFGQDHVRYVRTAPGQTSYSLQQDVWTGTNANHIANLQEPELGYITVTAASGEVQLLWAGLKCAGLQTSTNLTGPWTAHPATDGTSSTNWPAAGSQQFFRLSKPNTP